ncbi:hypothetical protein [Micromonospora humida]|uniref:hypothetical protein n=1 Tax=Micromonospora humida TaxID=2809018 RepID=UPI0034344B1B
MSINHRKRRQEAGAQFCSLAYVTAERLADDLGVTPGEVERHLRTGVRAGWITPVAPGVWALTIPAGALDA